MQVFSRGWYWQFVVLSVFAEAAGLYFSGAGMKDTNKLLRYFLFQKNIKKKLMFFIPTN